MQLLQILRLSQFFLRQSIRNEIYAELYVTSERGINAIEVAALNPYTDVAVHYISLRKRGVALKHIAVA